MSLIASMSAYLFVISIKTKTKCKLFVFIKQKFGDFFYYGFLEIFKEFSGSLSQFEPTHKVATSCKMKDNKIKDFAFFASFIIPNKWQILSNRFIRQQLYLEEAESFPPKIYVN